MRVCLGSNNTHRIPVYQMVTVVGVVENSRSYKLGTGVTVNKRLQVAFGRHEKTFKVLDVSNSRIKEVCVAVV